MKNVSVLVAVGVNEQCYREVLAVSEGSKEGKASWQKFLRELKRRFRVHKLLQSNRWVVEQTFAWFNGFRRLAVRYERFASIHEAFLHLGLHHDFAGATFEMISR